DHFEDFEDIVTGTGANTFLFNKIEHSFTIDAEDAASLVLDFRASVQALKFTFTTENSVTTLTINEDSAILSGLSVFSDSFLPKITVVGVDANTTIWGGRNSNTFIVKDGATFDGTIEGGTGGRLTTLPL